MRAGSCEEKLGYLQNTESSRGSLIVGLTAYLSCVATLRRCVRTVHDNVLRV